ncbi:hypothetical protein Hanom_Chr09g00807121 [Helianthus anomalus]
MYLYPFCGDISSGFAASLTFLWSKQRTNARSMEGIAYANKQLNKIFTIFTIISRVACGVQTDIYHITKTKHHEVTSSISRYNAT